MRNIIFCILFLPFIFITGCKNQSGDNTEIIAPPPPPTNTGPGSVTLSFDNAPSSVIQVIARLTRNGYSDRVLVLTVSDSSEGAFGRMTDVAGGIWHLKVDALNNSGVILFTGETNVEVKAGQTALVSLQLLPATGSVEIHVTWGSGCAAVTAGLVSWWRAEDNTEDAVGTNHGILKNGTTFANGRVGKAFSFDGVDDYVFIPNSLTFNITGSFTIDAWIYPRKDTVGDILVKWGTSYSWNNQRSYGMKMLQGRRLSFGFSDTAHQGDAEFQKFLAPEGGLTLNAWNYVAGVYDHDAGKRKIFVNGIKIAERTEAPVNILIGVADVTIGAHSEYPNHAEDFFPGLIDEVGLYDRPLSDAEIRSIYLAGNAGKCK